MSFFNNKHFNSSFYDSKFYDNDFFKNDFFKSDTVPSVQIDLEGMSAKELKVYIEQLGGSPVGIKGKENLIKEIGRLV